MQKFNGLKQKYILLFSLTSLLAGMATFAEIKPDTKCSKGYVNLLRNALGSAQPGKYSSELQSVFEKIKLGDELPSDIFRHHDVNDVAKTYVNWVTQRESKIDFKKVLAHHPVPLIPIDFKETQICVHFWAKDADAILETRQIKNLHQTGTSSGFTDESARIWTEDLLAGLELGKSDVAKRLRPKSGVLNIPKSQKTGWVQGSAGKTYGDIAAVLMPEVKDRSVWVMGDSMGLVYKLKDKELSKTEAYILAHKGTFQRPQLSGSSAYFIETLTYGDIGMKDIDHLIIYDPTQAKALERFKKPIFLVKEVIENNHTSLDYVSILNQGQTKILPQSLPKDARSKFKKFFLKDK